MRYKVETNGVQVEEETVEGTTKRITITGEGTSKITVYTISQTGEETEGTLEVKKDTEVPNIAEISVTGKSILSISTTARGIDVGSGISSYEFLYKESGEASYKIAKTINTNEEICNYTYENLKLNKTYDLAVRVTDKIGKNRISDTTTEGVKRVTNIDYKGTSVGSLEELPEGKHKLTYIEEEQKLYVVGEDEIPDISGKNHTLYLKDGAIVREDNSGNNYISFNGTSAYGQIEVLEETIDWAGGFTVEFEAEWERSGANPRLISFGVSNNNDCFLIGLGSSVDLGMWWFNGSTGYNVDNIDTVSLGQKYKYKIEYIKNSSNYTIKAYRNGNLTPIKSVEQNVVINNVRKTQCWIGKSPWSNDELFKGKLYSLKITQANGEKILEYNLNKISKNSTIIQKEASGYEVTGDRIYTLDKVTVADLSGKGHTLTLKDGAAIEEASNGQNYISFDGTGYGQIAVLEETIDWAGGFTLEFEACWDAYTNHARIFDFGNGQLSNNILVSNYKTNATVYIDVINGSTSQNNYPLATISGLGIVDRYKIDYAKVGSGYTITTYKNEEKASEYQRNTVINNIRRTSNYVGKSNWTSETPFKGKIYLLKITQANGEKILEYDLSRI